MTSLEVAGLAKSFGGVTAVDDVTFSITPGHIHSIIGPNGAGKTTLFNLVAGLYVPTSGTVRLAGQDVTALAPHQRAALGLGRTFQNLQIFFNMSAIENVMVGRHLRRRAGFLGSLFALPSAWADNREARAQAARLMARVGLEAYLDAEADAMPYGALKRLEIARALAAEPSLLMLDEPAAGLNPTETQEIDRLIQSIAADGITVVLVEHDMKLVMGISDHIIVLDHGRLLAQGTPAEVARDPQVVAAYLGGEPA
ncbi:MAG: ABC transporter ATP-binding protein [Alphaproteobacteria bacterium]|jgi:branched-chain amino acid transport system ATP-binding protein|nr:ABC transporter ATP-binding protein [Alphaproteobacteria bacterium]